MELFICTTTVHLILILVLTTTETTRTTCSDETDLHTWRCITTYSGGVTNMLLITTTVWVLDWIHGNTTYAGPAVTLGAIFVVCPTSLQLWFINTTTTSDHAHSGTSCARDYLLSTGWLTYTCGFVLHTVTQYRSIVSTCSCQLPAITST
uniref:Uncharacterized protein n=1 Tax=Lygus hesperus TaxID=30085 RepID=A0A146KY20_LYGHE